MPSDESESGLTRRRALFAAGLAGAAGVAGLAGLGAARPEREDAEITRELAVEDEFDVDDTDREPAGADAPAGEISQRCDPEPDRIESISHTANLTFVDAWNERYGFWRDEDGENGGDSDDGITVQNSIAVDKAPERVDGALVYGVRLYSLCHVDRPRLARLALRRMEHELTVDPAVELRTVLPSHPIGPEDGVCTLTLLVDLPSGWNAGYERTTWVNEETDGRVETDRGTDWTTLTFAGEVSRTAAMEGYLELRSERPLSTLDRAFEWTVRGEATRRGL